MDNKNQGVKWYKCIGLPKEKYQKNFWIVGKIYGFEPGGHAIAEDGNPRVVFYHRKDEWEKVDIPDTYVKAIQEEARCVINGRIILGKPYKIVDKKITDEIGNILIPSLGTYNGTKYWEYCDNYESAPIDQYSNTCAETSLPTAENTTTPTKTKETPMEIKTNVIMINGCADYSYSVEQLMSLRMDLIEEKKLIEKQALPSMIRDKLVAPIIINIGILEKLIYDKVS